MLVWGYRVGGQLGVQNITDIIQQAKQGDTRAFDCLVRIYQDRAVAYARTLLHDIAAAEDATQDAFVQAWHDLPRLTNPHAFGAWLRRIVFKYCDRIRRSRKPVISLDDTVTLAASAEPAAIIEREDQALQVRTALHSLPKTLRETAVLYYFVGRNVREIADFLQVPSTTIKNRLHTARKQLRKELWEMAEIVLTAEKPSNTEVFADNVLARILAQFNQQEQTNPHTVDRTLLENGHEALFTILQEGRTLEFSEVKNGFTLLWRKWDFSAMSSFLTWFIAQPITDSQRAWAYIHLANSFAVKDSPAGAVITYETFERWLPERRICLSQNWPYFPGDESETGTTYESVAEIQLLCLSQSAEFARCYKSVFRPAEYFNKINTALTQLTLTPANLQLRFYAFRMAWTATLATNDFDTARHYVGQMHVLANPVEGPSKDSFRAFALVDAIAVERAIGNAANYNLLEEEMIQLLNSAETQTTSDTQWIRGERHNFAHHLYFVGKYEMALPLWEKNESTGGHCGGWGWLLHAATVWQLTQNKPRTLALLKEAAVHDDRDLVPEFLKRPEFAEVYTDSDFLAAIRR